jgi:hypothetical protein
MELVELLQVLILIHVLYNPEMSMNMCTNVHIDNKRNKYNMCRSRTRTIAAVRLNKSVPKYCTIVCTKDYRVEKVRPINCEGSA